MTPKERVHRALQKKPTDRVPVFMWFHPSTAHRLATLLDIPVDYVSEAMGNDVFQTWVNNNYAMEGIVHEHEGEKHTDLWGIEWTKEGEFNQISRFPLKEKSREDCLQYRFPEEHLNYLVHRMDSIYHRREDYFIGVDVSPCVFEMYWRLRGMDEALLDVAADEDFTRTMFAKCADFATLLATASLKQYAVDWLWTGDDVAGQRGLIMSPQQWRNMVKPELSRVVRVGKEQNLPVAYHCCGALRDIIPDLIEIGVDVLNPIQVMCPGMQPEGLKKEYGKHLAFMGGVDTQRLLPEGSVREVYEATSQLIETMTADGGGFILAATHTIPPETPDDNIFALFRAAGISREEIYDRAADIRLRLSQDKTIPPPEILRWFSALH